MFFRRYLNYLGDYLSNYINFAYLHFKKGQWPGFLNIRNPQTFNEKLVWLKTKYRHPNAHLYADKIAVRKYVKEKIGEDYLIPVINIYQDIKEIDFSKLPDQFVMKLNHGSGMNIICKDKSDLDKNKALKQLDDWQNTDYYKIGGEYQYKGIDPQILMEKYIKPLNGSDLNDYKIFCFDGVPEFIQVDVNRFTNHKRAYYDLNWDKLPFTILYPQFKQEEPRPTQLDQMIEVAKKLSKGFPHIRVDLYSVGNQIYFGELTFHHEGGFGPVIPRKYDYELGKFINLPDEVNN